MIISGKVYSITQVTDDITRIVLIKSRNKKDYYVSIMTYYHFSDVIRDKYLMGDYVKIWFRLRSNQRMTNDNKPIYYTDVIGEKIVLVKRKGLKIKKQMNDFGMEERHKYYIEETGEIIPQHSVKSAIQNNPNRDW